MDLKHQPKLNQGESIAELSRPAKAVIKRYKDKNRKAQGRKQVIPKKRTAYVNWFSPFLFQQIEAARVKAGGPQWSTRAIERELKKSDPEVFAKFSRTTIDKWIDRSGDHPQWSDKTLMRIQKGNDLATEGAGRKGVLVC